jgi:hypothetical protein
MPDKRLARRLNRSLGSVRWRRHVKGIRIFNPQKHHWTREDDKLLGLRPDAQIAKLLRISLWAVTKRRLRLGIPPPGRVELVRPRPWQAKEDALLGIGADDEVARKLGRSVASVRRRRNQLGIPSQVRRWTVQEKALVGKWPDSEVARRLAYTVKAVTRQRERMGIRAYGKR